MSRILIIGSYAQSLINFRGALLRAMRYHGHEVFACAPESDDDVMQQLALWGVHYRRVELHRTGLNPVKDFKSIIDLICVFREFQPDIILSYTIKPVIYGSLAARIASVPSRNALITGLGYTFVVDTFRQRLLNIIVRYLYRLALHQVRLVFFQNVDDLNLFQRMCLVSPTIKKVVVNGSGVDLDHYTVTPYPDKPSFLLIARLLEEKGVREYVLAAKTLKKKFPMARFHLVGWIDDAPSAILRSELNSWQQEGTIEFWGRLDDVRPAIRACSVYVLPSYREGTPRTVLEAMAMGRAVITTDAPGCRQTVEHGRNGFLVPIKRIDPLIAAMQHFIDCPESIPTMGTQSRLIAQDRYDVNKVNSVMLNKLGLC